MTDGWTSERQTLIAALQRTITSLELMSHAASQALDPQPRDTSSSRGGGRPPGGVDYAGDREADYRQKSAEHYKRRVGRANTNTDLYLILVDAEQALEAWRRPPRPSEPLPDDPRFKRWIAESPSSAPELARIYGLSTRTIHRWRSQYS